MKTVTTRRFSVGFLLWVLWALSGPVPAAENTDIWLNLEEPRAGAVYQGVTNLRGWAVAPDGVESIKAIKAYLDGVEVFDVPLGGYRQDLVNKFGLEVAARAGFSMALNYGDWSAGPHNLRVRAIDSNDDWRERSVDFEIARFAGDNYVDHPAEPVALDPLQTEIVAAADDDTAFEIRGVAVKGERYDLRLRWRNQVQGFAIEAITPTEMPLYDWLLGAWGACTGACGTDNATQTRSVVCLRDGGSVVADSLCVTPKPAASQVCTASECPTYDWQVGSWSACVGGSGEGDGTQTRSVVCLRDDGSVVADSLCPALKPATTQACTASQFCRGYAGLNCSGGLVCTDDTSDTCDPNNGDVDCLGVCVDPATLETCGGFAGFNCPSGTCVDNPGDSCDPLTGGFDCGGVCVDPYSCGDQCP